MLTNPRHPAKRILSNAGPIEQFDALPATNPYKHMVIAGETILPDWHANA